MVFTTYLWWFINNMILTSSIGFFLSRTPTQSRLLAFRVVFWCRWSWWYTFFLDNALGTAQNISVPQHSELTCNGVGIRCCEMWWTAVNLCKSKHTHRIHGAAIYGNMDPIFYHQYTPVMLALIYQHHGSVMGYLSISTIWLFNIAMENPHV